MTIRELVLACDNIRPGYIVIIKLKSATLTFEGIYDIPFLFADKEIKHFKISECYVKIWTEDR